MDKAAGGEGLAAAGRVAGQQADVVDVCVEDVRGEERAGES